MIYGYARVSTQDQSLDMQCKALKKGGVPEENIVTEVISGTTEPKKREKLSYLLRKMRRGDQLVIWKLDRLGRNTLDLLTLDKRMRKKKITLISLTEKLDTGSATGRFSFTILAAVAEMERNLTVERVRAGMDEARNKGKVFGRRYKFSPEEEAQLIEAYANGVPVKEIQEQFHIAATTLYRYLRKQEKVLTRNRICERIKK